MFLSVTSSNVGMGARSSHRRSSDTRLHLTTSGSRVTRSWCRATTSATGKTLHLRPHEALQRAARVSARNPDWLNEYRQHRPMVERSIAWLTRGNRKVRYRGRQERSLVASRHRSTEPAPIDRPGIRPQRHHLGTGLSTRKALRAPPIDCQLETAAPISVPDSGSDFTNAATGSRHSHPTNPLFKSLLGRFEMQCAPDDLG
jgi:hypothetical protein